MMWYWTLFTLRMMARIGLATAVVLWVVSQWDADTGDVAVGGIVVSVESTDTGVAARWGRTLVYHIRRGFRPRPRPGLNVTRVSSVVGIAVNFRYPRGSIQIDHWLLCLTFLIATVATSWRRKKLDVQAQEPVAEVDDE